MISVVSLRARVLPFSHPFRPGGFVGVPVLRRFPSPFSDPRGAADTVAPTYSSGEIGDIAETIVEVVFSETVAATGDDYTTGVTIKVNTVSQTISAGARQSDQTKVQYTIPLTDANDTITWEYDSGPGIITDQATPANDLAAVAAQTATNNVGTHFHFDKNNDSCHVAYL